MIAAAAIVLVCALAQISPSAQMPTTRPPTVGYILSRETLRFLRFSEDGTVDANGDLRHSQSMINVEYLANSQVRLQHVALSKNCYLVHENGQFRGSTPVGGNEIFQLERVGLNQALRLVNYNNEEEGSSSGSEPTGTNVTREEPTGTNVTREEQTGTNVTSGEPTGTTESSEGPTTETSEEPTGTTETSEEPTTEEPKPTVCYLGFPDLESAPRCYESAEYAATRFKIIHL